MSSLLHDLRHALRVLARAPGFTAVAVLTLGLGIGATTAIASVAWALLLRALPFRDAGRLVALAETHKDVGAIEVSYPDFVDWRAQARSFTQLAAYSYRGYQDSALQIGGEPVEVRATMISPELLPLLGVSPALGRGFTAGEGAGGNDRVALLSHRLWRQRFGGDPGVVGRPVLMNGQPFTIIGVLAPGRQLPFDTELFLPLSRLGADDRNSRMFHSVAVVGRLRPGVTVAQAQSEMSTVAARLESAYPATNRDLGASVVPLRDLLAGKLRPSLAALLGAVALVLLIACANVANLLLARAIVREREMALRTALGAGPGRLVRQFLTESLVLSMLGGLVGVGLAAATLPLLGAAVDRFGGAELAGVEAVALSLPVLSFTALLGALAALAFSVLPALRVARQRLAAVLQQGERGSTGLRRPLRAALVAGEMALAVVVLFGAALLVRSLANLLQIDPGFATHHLLSAKISLPPRIYRETPQTSRFYQQLLARAEQLPGVVGVATTNALPLTGSHARTRFQVEGTPAPPAGAFPLAQIRIVSPSYFRTLGIALIAGRELEDRDLQEGRGALIANQAFARRYLAGRNPVTSRILMGVVGPQPNAVPVVGVVADARDLGIDTEPEPELYFPGFNGTSILLVRANLAPRVITPFLRRTVLALDHDQPLYEVETMDGVLADSLAGPRAMALLLGLFAALALVLAAIGLYGVLSYSVAQRAREIGVRMALGARRGDILRLVVGQGCRLAAAGELAGVAAGLASARLLRGLLFAVSPGDPVAIGASLLLLAAVALAAITMPAWRAARVDPIASLRSG